MIEIRNLCGTRIEEIHAAFVDAFSEYEVKMNLPIASLQEMMTTRSYNPELSIGYFSENRLAGFILVGIRNVDGKQVGYDVATGVIKAFQKKGVGETLLKALIKVIQEKKIERFILEVLVNNIPAQKLYERNGFKITRRLHCFEKSNFEALIKDEMPVGESFHRIQNLDENQFSTFRPSWQNSFASYQNVSEKYLIKTISTENMVNAYGIVHAENGNVLQIGVAPDCPLLEHVTEICNLLFKSTKAKSLKYLNVEANSQMIEILEQIGFKNTIDQFEMEYLSKF